MTARQQRRLQQKLERKADKLERRRFNQSAAPTPEPAPDVAPALISQSTLSGERRLEVNTGSSPSRRVAVDSVSEKRFAANRANSQLSSGPKSKAGKQVVSQNATRHGLSGRFRVLPDESQQEFDALLISFIESESPADAAESEFVQQMAEALWLSRRSVRLQENCILALDSEDPETQRAARKDLALFMRYQTTHDRAFVRYSTELRKRRNERRRAARGFESQKLRAAAEQRRNELQLIRQAVENRKQERHETAMRLSRAKSECLELRNKGARKALESNPEPQTTLAAAA